MTKTLIPVTYIDLGPRDGLEIDAFLKALRFSSAFDLRIHGIEANPYYVEQCRERFANDPRVQIHNFAIGSSDGVFDFYLDPKGVGSSIYADKGNVGEAIKVEQKLFSRWLAENHILPTSMQAAVNIIKANIEGAKWDLINDMSSHNLFERFDLLCGPGRRVNGWLGDIGKVPSLKHLQKEAEDILRKHKVTIHELHASGLDRFDIGAAVLRIAQEKGISVPFGSLRKNLGKIIQRL
jgi:FkbM family methyltransferase